MNILNQNTSRLNKIPNAPSFHYEIRDFYASRYDEVLLNDHSCFGISKMLGSLFMIEIARYENGAWVFIFNKYYSEQEFLRLVRLKAFI